MFQVIHVLSFKLVRGLFNLPLVENPGFRIDLSILWLVSVLINEGILVSLVIVEGFALIVKREFRRAICDKPKLR